MIKKVGFVIIYYVIFIILFFNIYGNVMFSSNYVIGYFSETLFYICYNFIPIIFLLLPIILKIILKISFSKTMIYSFIITIMYIPILLITNLSITIYMKNFTIDKWNEKSVHLRYLMIEDFENKYRPIGKNKEEIIKMFGVDYSRLRDNDNSFCYVVGATGFKVVHYCFIYDDKDTIVDIKYNYN